MARADKQAAVAEIVDSFNDAAGAVLTDYRGLTVKELQDLRRSLGENADYAVVKNTLAKLAATEAGVSGFDELLAGPTAIAFLKGDVVEAAKGLRDFAKAHPALIVKGGYLDGRAIDAKEVAKLADLESREVLWASWRARCSLRPEAVVLFNAPIAQVARLAGALQAKAEQDPSILAGGAAPEGDWLRRLSPPRRRRRRPRRPPRRGPPRSPPRRRRPRSRPALRSPAPRS